MKYTFNFTRFPQLKEERNLSVYRIKKDIHRTSPEGIQRWLDGAELRGEDIVDVCNAYGISPIEFFLCDGQPIITESNSENDTTSESEILKLQLQLTTERAEMEKTRLQAVADLEKAHIRELMQKDIDLAKKEATIREEIRREMRDEYESQIATLRNQLLDLTAQYRELELTSRSYSNITAVADNKGSNYIAKK
jgi:hypothetical protein